MDIRQTRREIMNHLNAVVGLVAQHADGHGNMDDPMLNGILDRTNDAIEACYFSQTQ